MRFKKTVECHKKLPWLYIFFIVIFSTSKRFGDFYEFASLYSAPLVYFFNMC